MTKKCQTSVIVGTDYMSRVHVPTVSIGQQWQRTQVGKKLSCSQWGEAACTQGGMGFLFFFFFFGPFGEGEGVGFLLFPSCSQHVPNHSLSLSHIICLKLYSCNLYNKPEGGDYIKFILGFCIALFYFICCDGSIKDAP